MSAPPANAGALVGTRLGDYELVALLALGGTAEIYLARVGGHAGFEKYVVVKCLHDHLAYDPEFVQMFLDEARLGAQLDHSNIVQTLGLGEQDGRYYLVMEYVAGMSLALMARRAAERVAGSRIPPPLVLGLATQAASGLHYAHDRRAGSGQAPGSLNLVHRDISPQNLVVTFEGVVKIVDFGIAKAEERSTATRSGTIKGKFAYMSPEQCVAKHVDRRTDVFALGVVVHELLTGRRLFKRGSTYETYQAILECKVPPPSALNHELDPAIDAVIMPALAKDPNRRYQTAEAFGEAISAYLHRGGRFAGAGAISTFIEQFFQPEIADHGDRMRELLEGRASGAGGWDDDEAEELSGEELDEDVGDDDGHGELPPAAAVTGFEEGPGTDQEGAAVDGSTRIEMNPLARLAELNEQVRRSQAFPVPEMPTTIAVNGAGAAGRAALPAPPPAAPPVQPSPSPSPSVVVAPAPAPEPVARASRSTQAPAGAAVPPPAAAPAPARNQGPPRPVFAAAKPGGSIFGGNAGAKAGGAMFGGGAAAKPANPATPSSVKPLEIASLFGSAPAGRGGGESAGASPASTRPTALAPAVGPGSVAAAPQPARAPGFSQSVIPTVIAEPEPTPARPDTPASTVPTMSLELHDVIADLGNPGARLGGHDLGGGHPGHGAMPYGTPPGTPTPDSGGYTSVDSGGYAPVDSGGYPSAGDQVLLPAHLIGLPPVEHVPHWDGTFQHPRRGVSPVVLTVLLLAGIALATVLVILIARAA